MTINRGAKYSKMSGFSRLKDLLHAALVPRVEMSNVEEVQQHLRHIFILVDDILVGKKRRKKEHVFFNSFLRAKRLQERKKHLSLDSSITTYL